MGWGRPWRKSLLVRAWRRIRFQQLDKIKFDDSSNCRRATDCLGTRCKFGDAPMAASSRGRHFKVRAQVGGAKLAQGARAPRRAKSRVVGMSDAHFGLGLAVWGPIGRHQRARDLRRARPRELELLNSDSGRVGPREHGLARWPIGGHLVEPRKQLPRGRAATKSRCQLGVCVWPRAEAGLDEGERRNPERPLSSANQLDGQRYRSHAGPGRRLAGFGVPWARVRCSCCLLVENTNE